MTAKGLGLNVIVRPGKMGLSSAFLEGLQHAEGEVVGLMDADLQHPPELLPSMLKEIQGGADLVVASRYTDGGKMEGCSLHRRIVSRFAVALAHLLIPRTRAVRDPISGFFLLQREVIKGAELNPQSFKILLEILAKGKQEKITEIPYAFKPRERGESKMGFREVWNYARHLHKLLFHF